MASHPNIRVRTMPFQPGGWSQKLHHLFFLFWVLAWTVCRRPQWIYASDPLSCPTAVLLHALLRIPVIYHEHDSPELAQRGNFFMRCVLKFRRRLVQVAQACVLPQPERAKLFSDEFKGRPRIFCVWNCPSTVDSSPPRSPRVERGLHLVYCGSIGPARLPVEVLEALAMLPEGVRLHVIGYETIGSTGYLKTLQAKASELGISARVQILNSVETKGQVLTIFDRFDVGLALVPMQTSNINLKFMTGASNKAFEYLARGLALLVPDLDDWRKVYVEPGYGLACNLNDPTHIAQAFRWFLEHPVEMREMGERGRRRILDDWNYEQQFSPVLKYLEEKRAQGR